MNKKKRFVLWIGVVIVVGMFLCPPWIVENGKVWRVNLDFLNEGFSQGAPDGYLPSMVVTGPYGLLFAPPSKAKHIDMTRLLAQVAIVAILCSAIVFPIKRKDSDKA